MPIGEGSHYVPDNEWLVDLQHQNNSMVSIRVFAGTGTSSEPVEEYGDSAIQDLVDHLSAWPHLMGGSISAVKSRRYTYPVTPTPPADPQG